MHKFINKISQISISRIFNIDISGARSGHASHALHDQIFKHCMTNFFAMRHIFFNLMGNGTDLE